MIALLTLKKVVYFKYSTLRKLLRMLSMSFFLYHRTIIGMKCKDGVILGAEKLMFSKLLVDGTHRRIFNVDKHLGMVVNGKIPDGRHIMNYARNESNKFLKDFDVEISGKTLCNRLSLYLNAYTLYNSVRPFGSSEIIASWNEDEGYGLYMLEPSGSYYGYSCCTSGKGRQNAKAMFESIGHSEKLTCKEALVHLAKTYTTIIMLVWFNHMSSHETKNMNTRWVGFVRELTMFIR